MDKENLLPLLTGELYIYDAREAALSVLKSVIEQIEQEAILQFDSWFKLSHGWTSIQGVSDLPADFWIDTVEKSAGRSLTPSIVAKYVMMGN